MSDQSHNKPTGPFQSKLKSTCPPGLKIVYSDQAQHYRVGYEKPVFNGISLLLNNFLEWLAGTGQKKTSLKKRSSRSIFTSPSCFSKPLILPATLPDYGFRPRSDSPHS